MVAFWMGPLGGEKANHVPLSCFLVLKLVLVIVDKSIVCLGQLTV